MSNNLEWENVTRNQVEPKQRTFFQVFKSKIGFYDLVLIQFEDNGKWYFSCQQLGESFELVGDTVENCQLEVLHKLYEIINRKAKVVEDELMKLQVARDVLSTHL